MGSGLVALTPCKLPDPSIQPISVEESGAVLPFNPTDGFEAATDEVGKLY